MLSHIEVNNRQSLFDWENSNSGCSIVEHIIYPHDQNADDATSIYHNI
jgi:hypothetical protein